MYTLNVDCSNKLLWVSCWWSFCMHEYHTAENHGLSCDHFFFVHPRPTCKPMSNVTFTTWGHPYGELTHVKIRHLLTYHMTLLQARFVHTARQCKMSRLATEIVHLAIYTRPYCGLIFLPIIRMNVVLNRTVTVTWDTNTLLECTRCSKARNVTQTHH